ncbi:MAG: type VI secretion system-associated protein TagF [Deltaproteobacteria bacterium]|nr:type VI secretion system-associated protein TagF [Deltaproteobacteria bacterium]
MALWRRRNPQPPSVSCYGKLPATGDFVRLNASGAEHAAYDRWLQGAMNLARQSLDEGFLSAYQGAAGLFVYRGEDGEGGAEPERGLVGVWAASGDSAGRYYPMTVALSYDYEHMLAAGPGLVLAVWPFLQAAYELVQNGRGLPVDQFLARVQQLPVVALDAPSPAQSKYQAFLQQSSMRAFWETTFGTVDSRFAALQMVHASIDYFRDKERPQTNFAMRMPLAASDAYGVAFWSDLTVRLAHWQRTVVNAFWTPQREAMLHVGAPHVATLRELLAPGTASDHLTDLLAPLDADEAAVRVKLGGKLEAAVLDPATSLAAFLAAV